MKTNPEALKKLYVAMGGNEEDVADISLTPDMIEALADIYEGGGGGVETIVLSAEERTALKTAIDAIATTAAADAGTTYWAQESGGISEANYNRILEAYAAGKNVNIVIQFGNAPLTLTSISHIVVNANGFLVVNCASFGKDQAVMDVRITFVCGYDSPTGEEPLEYYAKTMVALSVPKTAD